MRTFFDSAGSESVTNHTTIYAGVGTAELKSVTNHTAIYAGVGTFLVIVLICDILPYCPGYIEVICHFIYHEDSIYYV